MLHEDDALKKGQIAHLDQDPSNNNLANLAFLCLDHHDEYDSKTSQSKGLTKGEIVRYRDELYAANATFREPAAREHIFRFLADTISVSQMADGATKIAGQITWNAEDEALWVLTDVAGEWVDGDLWEPHLYVLHFFSEWGWLTYDYMETREGVNISVEYRPICHEIAVEIRSRIEAKK